MTEHFQSSVPKVTKDGDVILSSTLDKGERLLADVQAEVAEKKAKRAAKAAKADK